MKAVVLRGARSLEMTRRDIPAIGEREILLKVKSAAICGTDIRMWNTGAQQALGHVLGHEISGVIEEVGKGVTGYRAGDRVAVAPNMGCGRCDLCVSGRTHLCAKYRALGIQLDGGFAEYCVIPEAAVLQGNVCRLAGDISYSAAAAVEPLSCVYNGFEHYRVEPGDVALIIGGGPIGAMHAMLAGMAGASRVIVNDLARERLDVIARILPGVETFSGEGLREYIMDSTGGRGVDVCVTACPSPEAQIGSFELMAMNGRVCFFGGLPAGRNLVPLNTNLIHYKQLTVSGTTRSSLAQYRKCLRLVETGVIDLDRIITDHFRLDQYDEAFGHVVAAKGLKSVFDIGGLAR